MKLWKFTSVGLVALVCAAAGSAQAATIEGELLDIELHDTPRHIKVRTSGGEVQQTIANRTRVVFDPSEAGYFPNAELSDLKPGMKVSFETSEGVLDRVYVRSVPPNLRPPLDGAASAASEGREIKVRIQSMNPVSGEFQADVAGKQQTFKAETPSDLREVRVGELAILTLDKNNAQVATDVRSASVNGTIVSVDRERRQVVIRHSGREETFGLPTGRLEVLRVGQAVRFEAEERPGGVRVITAFR